MSYSEAITREDLKNILNELLPVQMNTAKIGEIIAYAGSNEPLGWLKCDGRAVSRTTYSALFDVIGTTYGSGDGSTTFNLPNFVDRFPVGAGNLYSLNEKDGSKDAVVVSHHHLISSGWQTAAGQPDRITYSSANGSYQNVGNGNIQFIQDTGVSGTGKNMPPYIGINYLIYVGGDIATIPIVEVEYVTSGNVSLHFYKTGNVVQVQSWGSFPATNDGITIATIPSGFRPMNSSDFTVFNTDGSRLGIIRFNANGAIAPTFGNLTAGAVRGCWTYICS